jgi:hypothetical protein
MTYERFRLTMHRVFFGSYIAAFIVSVAGIFAATSMLGSLYSGFCALITMLAMLWEWGVLRVLRA